MIIERISIDLLIDLSIDLSIYCCFSVIAYIAIQCAGGLGGTGLGYL